MFYFCTHNLEQIFCLVDSELAALAAEFETILGSDLVCKLQFVLPFFARFKLQKTAQEHYDAQSGKGPTLVESRRATIFKTKESEIIVEFAAIFHHVHRGLKKLRSLKSIGQENTLSAQSFRDDVIKRLKKIVRILSVRCF